MGSGFKNHITNPRVPLYFDIQAYHIGKTRKRTITLPESTQFITNQAKNPLHKYKYQTLR